MDATLRKETLGHITMECQHRARASADPTTAHVAREERILAPAEQQALAEVISREI